MGDVDTRKITLAPELAAAVDEAVASGEYPSVSAVLDEALGRWKEERENFGYTREELRALVQEGIDSGPGRFDSMEAIKAEARSRLERSSRLR
jgi:antitoxin ParD1/3/4